MVKFIQKVQFGPSEEWQVNLKKFPKSEMHFIPSQGMVRVNLNAKRSRVVYIPIDNVACFWEAGEL